MLGHNLFVLAALTATAAPLPRDDGSTLRAKFEKGRLTIDIGGQTSKVHLVQTQKTTYKVSDSPPPGVSK